MYLAFAKWGPYQRAKLVTELRDRYGLEPGEVAERIGMSTQEVNRRYRAFKALGQMQLDPDYGERADPSMYGAVSRNCCNSGVRDGLGWNEQLVILKMRTSYINSTSLSLLRNRKQPAKPPKITTFGLIVVSSELFCHCLKLGSYF